MCLNVSCSFSYVCTELTEGVLFLNLFVLITWW